MSKLTHLYKRSVTAFAVTLAFSGGYALPAWAGEAELLGALREAAPEEAPRIEREIVALWSKSGSSAIDFLLKRGRDAMEIRDWPTAIEHLTALTDHAPAFAEGYHARAIAYFRAERFGPAIGDLETVLRLKPNHFGAMKGLGSIFETLGDHKRAHEAYGMVLALHPNDEEAQKGLARTEAKAFGRAL